MQGNQQNTSAMTASENHLPLESDRRNRTGRSHSDKEPHLLQQVMEENLSSKNLQKIIENTVFFSVHQRVRFRREKKSQWPLLALVGRGNNHWQSQNWETEQFFSTVDPFSTLLTLTSLANSTCKSKWKNLPQNLSLDERKKRKKERMNEWPNKFLIHPHLFPSQIAKVHTVKSSHWSLCSSGKDTPFAKEIPEKRAFLHL